MKSGTEGLTAGLRALITDWVIRHPAVQPYVNLLTINQKETGQLLCKVWCNSLSGSVLSDKESWRCMRVHVCLTGPYERTFFCCCKKKKKESKGCVGVVCGLWHSMRLLYEHSLTDQLRGACIYFFPVFWVCRCWERKLNLVLFGCYAQLPVCTPKANDETSSFLHADSGLRPAEIHKGHILHTDNALNTHSMHLNHE